MGCRTQIKKKISTYNQWRTGFSQVWFPSFHHNWFLWQWCSGIFRRRDSHKGAVSMQPQHIHHNAWTSSYWLHSTIKCKCTHSKIIMFRDKITWHDNLGIPVLLKFVVTSSRDLSTNFTLSEALLYIRFSHHYGQMQTSKIQCKVILLLAIHLEPIKS